MQNLGLALLASWSLPASQFGVVASTLAFVQLSQAVVLSGVGEVVLVKHFANRVDRFVDHGLIQYSLLVCIGLSLLLMPVAIRLEWSLTDYLAAAMLVIVSGWAFGTRVIAYAIGSAQRSALASLLPVGLTLVVSTMAARADQIFLALSAGLVLSTLWLRRPVLFHGSGLRLIGSDLRTFMSAHRSELRYSVSESLLAIGAYPIVIILVGLIAGQTAAAFLQAGSSLLGPVTVMVLAGRLMVLPAMADAHSRNERRVFNRFLLSYSVVGLLGSLLFSVLAVAISPILLKSLFREVGSGYARELVLLICLHRILSTIGTGPSLALRALGSWRLTVRVRLFAGISTIVFAVAGAAIDSVRGSIVGICVAALVSSSLWGAWYVVSSRARLQPGRI